MFDKNYNSDNVLKFLKENTTLSNKQIQNTKNLIDPSVAVELGPKGEIVVDKYSQTKVPSIYALGDVTIKGIFGARTYDINMITFQAMVLLHFSEFGGQITFDEVCDQVRMDHPTGKRVLHSLACGKYKVLKKSGKANFGILKIIYDLCMWSRGE